MDTIKITVEKRRNNLKISPTEILKILEENGIKLATRVTVSCENGHKFSIKVGDISATCPDCLKYTKPYIEDMIKKRRAKSLRIRDNDLEKITPCCVYIVKLTRDEESFFKIGLSVKSPLERLAEIPYEVQVIRAIFTNQCRCTYLERILHKLHDDAGLSHIPNIGFVGVSECFSDVLLEEIDEIISDENASLKKYADLWLENI